MNKQRNEKRTCRYVNLMTDSGFKAVFADKSNKELLIGLLNHVLTDSVRVKDIVSYKDREQGADHVGGKKTILDLVCIDDTGKTFSAEVQRRDNDAFFERCVYYACGLYHITLGEAEQYNALLPVHLTAITSFKCPHDDEKLWNSDEFISRYRMAEERTGEFGRPTIFINFVELGRFTKSAEECVTEKDWLFFWFKHGWELDDAPEACGERPFMKSLIDACEIAAFPMEKKLEYGKDIMTELDIIAQRQFAEKQAEAKGIQKVARNLLTMGLAISDISKATGLTEKELSEIKEVRSGN